MITGKQLLEMDYGSIINYDGTLILILSKPYHLYADNKYHFDQYIIYNNKYWNHTVSYYYSSELEYMELYDFK